MDKKPPSPEPHVVMLRVPADVNFERARQLHDECRSHLDDQKRDFVIDLSCAAFIDSAGLEWLLWIQDAAGEVLGQVRLVGVCENVAEILRITRLASAFQTHPDAEAAVQSLKV
jgi:anti-anti-sigma factor